MAKAATKKSEVRTQAPRLTRAELAAGIVNARPVAKAGIQNVDKNDEVLELDVPYDCTITGVQVLARGYEPKTPQLVFSMTTDSGEETFVAKRLPLEDDLAGQALGLSAEEFVEYDQRARRDLLAVCRAIDPAGFSVAAEIMKDGKKWTYLDAQGNEMSTAARAAAAKEIDAAVEGVAARARKGDFSFFADAPVVLVRKSNPNSPAYPYNNFYPTGTTADDMSSTSK